MFNEVGATVWSY